MLLFYLLLLIRFQNPYSNKRYQHKKNFTLFHNNKMYYLSLSGTIVCIEYSNVGSNSHWLIDSRKKYNSKGRRNKGNEEWIKIKLWFSWKWVVNQVPTYAYVKSEVLIIMSGWQLVMITKHTRTSSSKWTCKVWTIFCWYRINTVQAMYVYEWCYDRMWRNYDSPVAEITRSHGRSQGRVFMKVYNCLCFASSWWIVRDTRLPVSTRC